MKTTKWVALLLGWITGGVLGLTWLFNGADVDTAVRGLLVIGVISLIINAALAALNFWGDAQAGDE